MSMRSQFFTLFLGGMVVSGVMFGQLPDGHGRDTTGAKCIGCHEIERSISLRQDKDGWYRTINKMVGFGMKASDTDINTMADYLSKYFPADALPPVNINTASAIELESRLSLKRSEAAALIAFRKMAKINSFKDLQKVQGLDAAKLESKRDRMVY